MGKVKDKILSDAAETVKQIQEEYLLKVESMRAVYDEGLKNSAVDNGRKLASLYEGEMKRLLGIRRLELRKKLLSAKREILRQLTVSVKDRVRRDPVLYKQYIENAVRRGVKTGTEEIAVSQSDRGIFTDEFMQHLNNIAAEKLGRGCSLRLSGDDAEIDGGVILMSGREIFNAALAVTVDSAADEFEPELAVMLFGGDN
jgi:vacuolar-type H+-ATPase subunit E/Vma4